MTASELRVSERSHKPLPAAQVVDDFLKRHGSSDSGSYFLGSTCDDPVVPSFGSFAVAQPAVQAEGGFTGRARKQCAALCRSACMVPHPINKNQHIDL